MKRAWVLASLWAAATGALALFAGCYGHTCDPSTVRYGRQPGEGHLLDPNTWESNPVDGDWLPFPHQRSYDVDLAVLGDRAPALVLPYVSASKNPLAVGDNFTIAGGNLTEISAVTRGHVTVHNGTCADYYLRLVVVAPPIAPAAQPADAGTTEGGLP